MKIRPSSASCATFFLWRHPNQVWFVDQRLEERLGRQHLDGVADDVHECRVFAAVLVVKGKAERGKEGLDLFRSLTAKLRMICLFIAFPWLRRIDNRCAIHTTDGGAPKSTRIRKKF